MQALILETLGERIDFQLAKIENLRRDLLELDKQKRALWIAEDLDGANVTADLDMVTARQAETELLLERSEMSLDELKRRKASAVDEIAMVHHRENCRAMQAANELTPKLERAYRRAAAVYFDALGAMLGNVATQKRLAHDIDRFAYGRPDCETVAPVLPGVRVAVESDRAIDYFTDAASIGDNLSVAVSLSVSRFGYPMPDDRNVAALERVATWHK